MEEAIRIILLIAASAIGFHIGWKIADYFKEKK